MDRRNEKLARLVEIIDRLRAKDGCPWDLEQTLDSMVPCLQEEAAEVTEAIATGPPDAVREELGDLLMNVFLMSRIAEQDGRFSLADVAEGISDKLVRRHPHVFGDVAVDGTAEVLANWESIKQGEKQQAGEEQVSVLGEVPPSLPPLARATRLGARAASVGFDWPDARSALEKVTEELEELRCELDDGGARLEEEAGDLLLAMVSVLRLARVDPDLALRRACARFVERFRFIEERLGDGLADASLEEMERLWQEAKAAGR